MELLLLENEVLAMSMYLIFYSFMNIAMGVFVLFMVEDKHMVLKGEKVSFKGFAKVVKNPAVWIICLVSFCNHVFCLSLYYYIPYVTDILGASVTFGAMLGVFRKIWLYRGEILQADI